MPHRKNAKGDIGTAKLFSDSYDADNIYLSEEGWVYRHFKNNERTMWWDEIIVAGQVIPGQSIHGVTNDDVSETNPKKLGTDDAVVYNAGDGHFDIEYAGQPGHSEDYVNEVIPTDPKPTGFDKIAWEAIGVDAAVEGNLVSQIPEGWNVNNDYEGWSDPSNVIDFPDEPPYDAVATTVLPNQYNESPYETPEPGYEYQDGAQDPQGVIVGVQVKGATGAYTTAQNPSPAPGASGATGATGATGSNFNNAFSSDPSQESADYRLLSLTLPNP